MTLHYLPPVALEFTMPSGYPTIQNCGIAVKCVWLNQHQIAAIEEKLDGIWQDEKSVVCIDVLIPSKLTAAFLTHRPIQDSISFRGLSSERVSRLFVN